MVDINTTFLAIACACAGVTLLLHTAFFIFKLAFSRDDGHYEHINNEELGKATTDSHGFLSSTIPLSSTEVTCFMGLVWSACVHHGRMAKYTFLIWYFTVAAIDIGLSVGLYFILQTFFDNY